MPHALRLVLFVLTAATLAGCYVAEPVRPGPGRPYAAGTYVAGHFGPSGFWIPGHYR